jgi:hypothetical protein
MLEHCKAMDENCYHAGFLKAVSPESIYIVNGVLFMRVGDERGAHWKMPEDWPGWYPHWYVRIDRSLFPPEITVDRLVTFQKRAGEWFAQNPPSRTKI